MRPATALAPLLLLAAACAPATPAPAARPAPQTRTCDPISEQERWGFAVEDPAARGFTLVQESPHFRMYAAEGARVDPAGVETGEAHVAAMEALLGERFGARVDFFVYPDEAALQRATGQGLLIRRDVRQLHLLSSRHLHEMVHLITYQLAGHRSVPLLEEGIAEAYGNWSWRAGDPLDRLAIKDWTGEHVDAMAARWLAAGTLPELGGVLTDRAFRGYEGPLKGESYVFAASFVLFLVREHGAGAVLALLRRICVEDDAGTVQAKLREVLGRPLEELEQAWRAQLREGAR